MSGTIAPATFEKTMPVNSLMPSVFMKRSAICLPWPGFRPSSSTTQLHRHAAELAAFHLDREVEGVAHVLPEIAARPRQRRDHADLHRLLRQRGRKRERSKRRAANVTLEIHQTLQTRFAKSRTRRLTPEILKA